MANSDDPTKKIPVETPAPPTPTRTRTPTPTPAPPTPTRDVEAQVSNAPVSSIVNRWKRIDLLKKGSLVLRGAGLIFSLLAFIVMVSNQHGNGQEFDDYEEYRYLVAISILSTIYTAAQLFCQLHHCSTGKELLDQRSSNLLDFFGDQILAYLLISSASAAVPQTNGMRTNVDNLFTDSSAASISMAFFAFFALALSAMLSGFKLSNQTYI